MSSFASRSWLMVRSRWACTMSPLIAAAENPRARSRSASCSVTCLVRTKTIIPSKFSTSRIRVRASSFCGWDHLQVALGGVGRRRGLVLDGDLGGVGEVLLRDPADLRRHGRGEQRDVLVVRGAGQDRLDVLGEAHLEHLVGLVEHQEAQLGQVQGALLQVVHDPAGGADHDVHAAAQGGELDAVPLAAVDRQHVQAGQVRGVPLEGLGDLERQLTGRRQHQRLRRLLLAGRSGRGSARANAAVLPVPVCASPTTWRPSSSAGMVAAWIGEGDS